MFLLAIHGLHHQVPHSIPHEDDPSVDLRIDHYCRILCDHGRHASVTFA